MVLHERWTFLISSSIAHMTFRLLLDQTSTLVARLSGEAEACKNGKDLDCLSLDSSEFNNLFVAHTWAACFGAFLTGFFIRKFGVWRVSLSFSAVLFLGSLLFSLGPYVNYSHDGSYAVLLCGRILFGFAMFAIVVLSLQVFSHWFFQKEMALAFAIYFSSGKVGSIIALSSGGILIEHFGLQLTLWITFAIGLLGPAGTVMSGLIYRRFASRQMQVNIFYDSDADNSFDFGKVKSLTLDFWVICLICLLYYAVAIGAITDYPKYIIEVFHYPEGIAGLMTSLFPICALLAPIFGWMVDRFGYRDIMTLTATGTLALAFLCQTLIDIRYPAITAATDGLTYAVCSASVWSSISVIEHPRVVGVAMGIATGAQQFGLGLMFLITGFVLNAPSDTRWTTFFAIQTGASGLACLLAGVTIYLDWKNHGMQLRKPRYSHDADDSLSEKSSLMGREVDSETSSVHLRYAC